MHICEMLFLTCTEHTSTISPVSETQDYGYLNQVKGAVIIWTFRIDMCRIESQKICEMCTVCRKCICIFEMLFLTCTEYASTMSPELMKLRIMTISIKTKVLIKFGASELICVELRAKKL